MPNSETTIEKNITKVTQTNVGKLDMVIAFDTTESMELSAMTNGVSVPFRTIYNTADLMRASVLSRSSMKNENPRS